MKKILVANRGEIALRVMKTCRRLGIKTVAIYSDADRDAPHVKFADEAVHIGPAPSSQSYLVIEKIVAAAQNTGADGIHPGYGFLSENSKFAQAAHGQGIIFIGPKPHAIEVMGSKLAAKEAVSKYDIPMVPGVDRAVKDAKEAKEIADRIGFPILIKASAGGGGKGMRIVKSAEELSEQMERAIGEASSAFGDGSVFIEKYVSSPRHIEIQILADQHDNIVHLFERECSIQRRHQKVVEEAPSCILTPELRDRMGDAAVRVARACQYEGAGTVEFLLDEDHNFYFLEMNTRLQVEHPVTELITNVDLVELQIQIARGQKLPFSQEDLKIKGHALELRVYAENPLDNFSPNIGKLTHYVRPKGIGIRVDDGYEEGMEIPVYYDSMIAKLITYGNSRNEAIQKMKEAISDYEIKGIQTTLPFGEFVCDHPQFASGNFDTHFIKDYYDTEAIRVQKSEKSRIAGLVALKHYLDHQRKLQVPKTNNSQWEKRKK